MALIKCPECGKEISDKAASCPNCGCPANVWMAAFRNNDTNSTYEKNDKKTQKTVNVSEETLDKLYDELSRQRIIIISELSKREGIEIKEASKIVKIYWEKRFPEKKLLLNFPS